MSKMRYSTGMKVAAVVFQEIFAVILVLTIVILGALLEKNILDFGNLKNNSFESSRYFASKFQHATEEVFQFIDLRRKFETDGNYDDEKVINIWDYCNSHQVQEAGLGRPGNSYLVSYSLGDLAEWSRSFRTSTMEFVSEYYLDDGIHQSKTVYRNGEILLKEEKQISSLGEMTAELQENIIQHVEHYYGGS